MDLGTLLGLVVSVAVPVIGGIIAAGKLFQKVSDHDDEISEVKEHAEQLQRRLEKTEEATRNIGNLQSSIEHMGQLFAEKLGNLSEALKIHNTNNNRRFDELNERLNERRSFRSNDE